MLLTTSAATHVMGSVTANFTALICDNPHYLCSEKEGGTYFTVNKTSAVWKKLLPTHTFAMLTERYPVIKEWVPSFLLPCLPANEPLSLPIPDIQVNPRVVEETVRYVFLRQSVLTTLSIGGEVSELIDKMTSHYSDSEFSYLLQDDQVRENLLQTFYIVNNLPVLSSFLLRLYHLQEKEMLSKVINILFENRQIYSTVMILAEAKPRNSYQKLWHHLFLSSPRTLDYDAYKPDVIEMIIQHPRSKEFPYPVLGELIVACTKWNRSNMAEALAGYPAIKGISLQTYQEILLAALIRNNIKIFSLYLKHPQSQKIGWDFWYSLLLETLKQGNEEVTDIIMESDPIKKIPTEELERWLVKLFINNTQLLKFLISHPKIQDIEPTVAHTVKVAVDLTRDQELIKALKRSVPFQESLKRVQSGKTVRIKL